jgi:hydrogenase nickel incorporation protein HypA/HybF
LSGVEIEALKFCFQAVSNSSSYPDLKLIIERIPGEGRCAGCNKMVPMHEMFTQCPACGNFTVESVKGQELRVTSIEVE